MAFVVESNQTPVKLVPILLRRNISMCEPDIKVDIMLRRRTVTTKRQVNLILFNSVFIITTAVQYETGVHIVTLIQSIRT